MPKAPEGTTRFRLVVFGDGSVRTVNLVGSRWTVGRTPDCDVYLRDPTVSRRHVLIERVADSFRFQDLGAANPPHLDGKPVRQGELRVGSPLTIGLTQIILEERNAPSRIETDATVTIVMSREVADDEPPARVPRTSMSAAATQVLERIEWTFADLGDLADAAEPLLDLARNLCGFEDGCIARFGPRGSLELLATSAGIAKDGAWLPQAVVDEARRIGRPHLLSTREGERQRERLLVPFGGEAGGLLLLEGRDPDSPANQDLLRLAHALGRVTWHRMQETMERLRLRAEVQRLRFKGTPAHNALLTSFRLQAARELLRSIAGGDDPVLFVGEEGTELEDLARYLHSESPRRSRPFVTWDAGRCPADRHATELLGDGLDSVSVRAADGTLLILHPELLATEAAARFAEGGRGAGPARPAARLLAATHDPTGLAERPSELFRRLEREPVGVPPLRSDTRDVVALAELFLTELGPLPDGSPRLMTERAKNMLMAYGWPGNTRELRFVIEAAATRAGSQPIAPRHLPESIANTDHQGSSLQTLEDVERAHIARVMEQVGGVRTRAAQVLGIATSTLYEKLKRYRLDR